MRYWLLLVTVLLLVTPLGAAPSGSFWIESRVKDGAVQWVENFGLTVYQTKGWSLDFFQQAIPDVEFFEAYIGPTLARKHWSLGGALGFEKYYGQTNLRWAASATVTIGRLGGEFYYEDVQGGSGLFIRTRCLYTLDPKNKLRGGVEYFYDKGIGPSFATKVWGPFSIGGCILMQPHRDTSYLAKAMVSF